MGQREQSLATNDEQQPGAPHRITPPAVTHRSVRGSSEPRNMPRSIRPGPPNMHCGRGRRAGLNQARRVGRVGFKRLRVWASGKAMGGRWTGAGCGGGGEINGGQ